MSTPQRDAVAWVMRPRRLALVAAAVCVVAAVLFTAGVAACLNRAHEQRAAAATCEEAAHGFAREFFTPQGSQWVPRVAETVVDERRPLLETIDPATIPTVPDPRVVGSERQEGACDVTVSAGDLMVRVEVIKVDGRLWRVDRWFW